MKDNSGAVAYTDIVTVQQGPDSSCGLSLDLICG